MIPLYLGKKTYYFPGSWEDLNPKQFILLVETLYLFNEGKINFDQACSLWFMKIAGLKFRRKENDQFWENIYRASQELNFFGTIKYEKSISHLTQESRKMLERKPPVMCRPTPEIRWARKLKFEYVVDPVFCAQLVPECKKMTGYRLERKGDLFLTDLTAKQFVDANMAFEQFVSHNSMDFLDITIAILYKTKSKNNSLDKRKKLASKMPIKNKHAIITNYQAFVSFLARKTKYSLLWSGKAHEGKNKIRIGLADSIYSLSKIGYGQVSDVENTNLITFLDLQLKNTIDMVQMMHENEMSVIDISDKTGLTLKQINRIV